MPTYEYRCPDGHEFEQFYRKISDAASELPCPECGKLAVRRLSGGAGLVFKGSGFYLTDYGKNAHRRGEPAKREGGESSSGESKPTESKPTESKPAESKPAESSASSDKKPSDSKSTSGSSSTASPPKGKSES